MSRMLFEPAMRRTPFNTSSRNAIRSSAAFTVSASPSVPRIIRARSSLSCEIRRLLRTSRSGCDMEPIGEVCGSLRRERLVPLGGADAGADVGEEVEGEHGLEEHAGEALFLQPFAVDG